MITSIVVDDELNSRENLKILLEEFCQDVRVVGTAESVDEAQQLIATFNPDVVFLDIQMSGETGFDLLERYEKVDFEVMFITAYSDYALKAIKFSAVDYILKPIDIEELRTAVDKVKEKVEKKKFNPENIRILLQNLNSHNEENYKIAIPTSHGMVFIKLNDIIYCEGQNNYTVIHTKKGEKHMVSKTLKDYEGMLSDYNFFRIHKSFLINMNEVKEYLRGDGGSVIMNNNDNLLVSKRKKEAFLERAGVVK